MLSTKDHTKCRSITGTLPLLCISSGTYKASGRLRVDPDQNELDRSNIEAHYDLSNELFKTFLDTDYMLYSCGIYHADMGR